MRSKNNTRQRKKSIQGLRSFRDSLPKDIRETISKKADIYFRLKRLIHKNFMGELFKVMFVTKKNIKFKIGF